MKTPGLKASVIAILILLSGISGYFVGLRRGATPETAVFKRPFVKRVIGIPGDTIEVKSQTVYVNGKAMEDGDVIRFRQ
jgi:signal peptidase I